MAVRVLQVAADLSPEGLRLGKEFGTARQPFSIDRMHIGYADVQGARKDILALRRRGGDIRLVVGRTATDIENEPALPRCNATGSRSRMTSAPNTWR